MLKKIRKKILAFVLVLCLLMSPMPTHVNAADSVGVTIGQIGLFPYNFTPTGWAECNGQSFDISSNRDLYNIIGFVYGGNNVTLSALPNLSSANPYSTLSNSKLRYYIATAGDINLESNAVIGQVCLMPDNLVKESSQPGGIRWLKCDGSSYDTATYSELYNAIKAKFGENLPDLSNSSPIPGMSYYICCKRYEGDPEMPIYIGSINLFASNSAPTGMLPCQGQYVTVSGNYSVLYSLLGNTYGGNGSTTFGIPDLSGLAPLPGVTYYISTTGTNPTGP